MTDLITQEQNTALMVPTVENFLGMLSKAASDPNVDPTKMHALLDVQERMMNKKAEMEFDAAFLDLQAEMPVIKKDGKIMHRDKATGQMVVISSFATYEAIDRIIRPLLIKNGFGLRFNSKQVGSNITVFGTLAHRGGHSITDEIPLTIESGGAKNNVQGVGSTISYGQRYLVKMLLNLIFEGEDDDAQKASYVQISDEHAAEIKQMLQQTGSDVVRFLEYMKVPNVDSMDERDYEKAKIAIRTTEQRKKQLAGAQ